MAINGLEGMTADGVNMELQNGAKFLLYQYCISIVIMTFRRSSDIYFVRAGQSGVGKGMPYTLVSLLFGWWGIPWGPIYTIGSLITNLRGGKDVTADVIASFREEEPMQATEPTRMTPSICPQCQLENQAGNSFCTGCGSPL